MTTTARYADMPTTKIWAEQAFSLLNEYEVDTVEELPVEQAGWLEALADTFWPVHEDSRASLMRAASSLTGGTIIAERLRREHKATMAGL